MFKSKLKRIIKMKKLLTFFILLAWFDGWGQIRECGTPTHSKSAKKNYLSVLEESQKNKNLRKATNENIIWVGLKFWIESKNGVPLTNLNTINQWLSILNRDYQSVGMQFFLESNPSNITFNSPIPDPETDYEVYRTYMRSYVSSTNNLSFSAINIFVSDFSFYGAVPSFLNFIEYTKTVNGSKNNFLQNLFNENIDNIILMKYDPQPASFSHEMGHYFCLYHTHHDNGADCIGLNGTNLSNCISKYTENGINHTFENINGDSFGGDAINDTPADPYYYQTKFVDTQLQNSCTINFSLLDNNQLDVFGRKLNLFHPLINNIMSYYKVQNNDCRKIFTNDQKIRIGLGMNLRTGLSTYNILSGGSNLNPPSDLILANTQNSTSITWTDNSTSETGYLIERSTNPNDDFICIGGVAPNVTSFTDNTILPNTNYYYRVRASNATIYNCNTSSILPFTTGEMTIDSKAWYAQSIQKATRIGLMNKWQSAIISDNSNIKLGEVAQSIIIVANLLKISGFTSINQTCWDNPYISHLKALGFLPNTAQSTDILKLGQLCDLVHHIIFENSTSYPYLINRSDMSSVIASTAPYKSSIEYLYQRIGFVKSSSGKKIGDYFFNGKFDNSINLRKITGNEEVTRAIFAKFIAAAYEFKYYQLNQKVVPNARIAQTNSVFDDIIIVGSKAEFDNDIKGIPPTITVDGTTEFLRSGQSKNFSFSTDQLSDGTKVFFYWNIEGGSQGLKLVPMPQYGSNFQGVTLTAPTVTSPQVFQFYIHISTIDGRTSEMFKEIMVVPNDHNNNKNLTTGEYFIDKDLGIGQATVLPITLNNYGADATIPIPTNNLTQGIHSVGIRVKDSNNKWSITHTKTFLVLGIGTGSGSQITQVAYFFDSTTTETIENVSTDANNQITIPITVNLTQGIHSVSFRVKDSQNKWSLYHTRTFLVLGQGSVGSNTITQVEYFFDADPSEANRIRQNITLDANNQAIIPLNISLKQGIHTVSFRVKDGQGKWSLFHTRTFLVIGSGSGDATISTIEYFMDSDPGFGNGKQVAYESTNNQAILLNINVGNLTHGVHVLFVRVKNSLNQWSLTHAKAFVVMPNLGNSASISRIEYFIDDANPSLGSGTNINFVSNPTNSDVLATLDLNTSQLSLGVHKINVRTKDSNNQWSSLATANFEIIQIPCPQSKNVTETRSSGELIHQASNIINVQNTTYNGTVNSEIKAGGSITIEPNTTLESQTVIKIYVGGCANN